jgi:hypothetical protein
LRNIREELQSAYLLYICFGAQKKKSFC